jgi:hypothetical protein
MDQGADITVLREKDSLFGDRLGQQGFIAGVRLPLADIGDVVASIAEDARRMRHDVESTSTRTLFGGDREAFGRGDFAQAGGVKQAGVNVLRLEHGISFQDDFPAGAIGKHGQNQRALRDGL